MDASNIVIQMKNLSFRSGSNHILQNINWTVQQGDHWVLYGMNGSGKTTLLSIIAGFQHYTSGSLTVLGINYDSDEPVSGNQNKIGFVSSSFFDKYLTKESVLNVVLSGKFGTLGLDADITLVDVKRAKALLEELHMEHKMYCTYNILSKGERQSVLLARALIGNPEILVLDEPFSGLDIYNRICFQKKVKELAQNPKLTILYVTHYAEEIDRTIFNKCILLNSGRIFAQGLLDDMLSSKKLNKLIGHGITVSENAKKQLSFCIANDIE